MDHYKIIKSYAPLYKSDKNSKQRVWEISAVKSKDNNYWVYIKYGIHGGKIIESFKQVKEGKNVGKSNETSIEQQIILMCDKYFKDKIFGVFNNLRNIFSIFSSLIYLNDINIKWKCFKVFDFYFKDINVE